MWARAYFVALFSFYTVIPGLAAPPAFHANGRIAPRDVCNADYCLRALRASSRDPVTASAFCKSFISSTPGTVTVTASATSTKTPVQITVTVIQGTTTASNPVACTETVYVKKRTASGTPTTALPSYLTAGCTALGTTQPAARASSACSCFLTSATTTITNTVTVTAQPLAPVTVTSSYLSTYTTNYCNPDTTVTSTTSIPMPTSGNPCSALPSTYAAPNGKQFALTCGYVDYASQYNIIAALDSPSAQDCYNACSITAGSVIGDYFAPQGSAGGNTCFCLSNDNAGGVAYDGSVASLISPPPPEST